jgi:hypothetical protein
MSRRGLVWKGIMCQKVLGTAVMIKYMEQIDNCETAWKYSVSQGNHLKVENPKWTTVQDQCICADSKTEWNVSFMQYPLLTGGQNSVHLRLICTSDAETEVFLAAKVFSSEEVTITLWGNDSVVQYAIQLSHSWCRCKICCHKKVQRKDVNVVGYQNEEMDD